MFLIWSQSPANAWLPQLLPYKLLYNCICNISILLSSVPEFPAHSIFPTPRKRPSSPPSGVSDESVSKKPKTAKKPAASVPFHEVLKGVSFVLSGYQNPLRGTIRDKALAMGAKYKPDWDKDSTHLICAFSNTPKYTQVLIEVSLCTRYCWFIGFAQTSKRIYALQIC